jgi:putative oxidoreductase
MKKIVFVDQTSSRIDIALLIARVSIAALMLTHGLPKMAMLFSGDPIQFPPIMGMSAGLSLTLAVFAEVFCSILILLGVGTRLATIPPIITMLVAITLIHSADPFAKKEMAIIYLLGYVVLLIAGSGKYSVDYLLQRKLTTRTATRLA